MSPIIKVLRIPIVVFNAVCAMSLFTYGYWYAIWFRTNNLYKFQYKEKSLREIEHAVTSKLAVPFAGLPQPSMTERSFIMVLTALHIASPVIVRLVYLCHLAYNRILIPLALFLWVNCEAVAATFVGAVTRIGLADLIDECSYFIDIFTIEHYGADRDLRALLDIKEVDTFKPSKYHTHGVCAAERTGAADTIMTCIRNAGLEPYDVSISSTNQAQNVEGCRSFYWAKDFKPNYQKDKIRKNHAFMMVDVDYYCDIAAYMKHFKPIIMYTLQPLTLSFRSQEYAYYIKDNKVHYDVSGGGRYDHEVWNYDSDTLRVTDKNGNNCVFHVVSKSLQGDQAEGSGRRMVSLVPLRKVASFCYTPPGPKPARKRYTYGEVNVIHDLVAGKVSLAENGSYESVHLTTLEYTALRTIADKKQKELVKSEVQSLLRRRYQGQNYPPYKEFELETPIMANLISRLMSLPVNAIATTGIDIRRRAAPFTVLGPDTEPINKFPGQIICSQLASQSAVLPAKNNNNSVASIAGRLTKVRNNKIPSRNYGAWAHQFVQRIVTPDKQHLGNPVDFSVVEEHQKRPLQKMRIENTRLTQGTDADNGLTCFIKNEAYATANDPRNITTMKPEFTMALSRFTYAFKEDCLKRLKSYGPGKTPLETTKILQELCRSGCVLTDYTRFDGSISQWIQENVVKRAYKLWSADPALINSLLDKIFKRTGTTTEGVKFNAYYGTRSGSPTTTDGNTMINMYITYCALRKLGYNDESAFALLGIYAGDDGVTPFINNIDVAFQEVANDLGLTVKLQVRMQGEPISYLGRIFPDINKTTTSYQDMTRTLPKLHISTNQQVSREQAAYNKACGYFVTDRLTPILGVWAQRVMEITDCGKVLNETREEQYKRENEAWPQSPNDQVLLIQAVADELGVSTEHVQMMHAKVFQTKNLDEFPVVWDNPTPDKVDALVGDSIEIVGTGQSVNTEAELLNPTSIDNTLNQNEQERQQQQPTRTDTPSSSKHPTRRSDGGGLPNHERGNKVTVPGHNAELPEWRRRGLRDGNKVGGSKHSSRLHKDGVELGANDPSKECIQPRLPRGIRGRQERTGTGQDKRSHDQKNVETNERSVRDRSEHPDRRVPQDANSKRVRNLTPSRWSPKVRKERKR
ncbi:MAG: nodavirus polyprotein (domains: methyltransferase, RdRP) [Koper noda-like virus 3]|nr:MAG: nodavirus polyprotein (domains: methyltransferase, RdRP) [Koper noda-like virus 3]